MKIRTKITLLFALLVTAILVLVSVIVYYFTQADREDAFRKRLRSRANYNAQIYSLLSDSNYTILDRINRNATILLPKKSINIFSTEGKLLYEFLASDAEAIKISPSLIQETRNMNIWSETYFPNSRFPKSTSAILDSAIGLINISCITGSNLFSFLRIVKIKFEVDLCRRLLKPVSMTPKYILTFN